MFTLYRTVKRSVTESVPDRASVHTRNAAVSAPEQHCSAPLLKVECSVSDRFLKRSEAMFTLYQIGFCSFSKVAPIQCEQELMFCCGAEIVPKHSQREHKPYPSYNLQRSLLISQDNLPKRGSVAISAPIKCSDLIRTVSETYPIRNVPLSTAEWSSTVPEQKLLGKQHS